MAKKSKHSEVLEQLHKMVTKQAEESVQSTQETVAGKPGEDTDISSVDEQHEEHDKNDVGADKLEQRVDQEHTEAVTTPAEKTASEKLELLANQIVASLKQAQEIAQSNQKSVAGTPGTDTNITGVEEKHEEHDKNDIGADKLPQGVTQTDNDLKEMAAVADLAEKVASYNAGREYAQQLYAQQLNQLKQAKYNLKTAGAKDFDALVAYASEELEKQAVKKLEKQAEEAGAEYFVKVANWLVEKNKQKKVAAYVTKLAEYTKALEVKLAEETGARTATEQVLNNLVKKAQEQQALSKKQAEYSMLTENISNAVLQKLSHLAADSKEREVA